jgi:hypothetical protein
MLAFGRAHWTIAACQQIIARQLSRLASPPVAVAVSRGRDDFSCADPLFLGENTVVPEAGYSPTRTRPTEKNVPASKKLCDSPVNLC